jgi:hypothetical protein
MPAGLFLAYQISAVNDAQQALYEQNLAQEGFTVPATTEELLKLTVGEKPAKQWVQDRTLEHVKLYYYAQQRFAELGLEMTDDLQMIVDYTTETFWAQSGSLLDENGISQDSLRLQSTGDVKLRRIFEALYGEGGEREVPLEELKQKFASDYASVDMILAPKPATIPEGSDKTTVEDAVAEVRGMLEAYIPRIQAGEAFEDLSYEFDVAQARLNLTDESAVVKPQPGELNMLIDKTQPEGLPPELMQELSASAPGDSKVIDVTIEGPAGLEEAIMLFRMNDVLADDTLMEQYRTTVLDALKYEEFLDDAYAQAAGVALEPNPKAVKRYEVSGRLKIA